MRRSRFLDYSATLIAAVFLAAVPACAALRKAKLGEQMPSFSLPDLEGHTHTYAHGGQRVFLIAFLTASQKNCQDAWQDLLKIASDFEPQASSLKVLAVVAQADGADRLNTPEPGQEPKIPVLLDEKYELWGTLGVIATPTVLVVTRNDTIGWVKAGYGYDFVPAVEAHLREALGLADPNQLADLTAVAALENATNQARAKRHLNVAQMFKRKGKITSAIAELHKARELAPESPEVLSELGLLMCQAGQPAQASEVADLLAGNEQTAPSKVYHAREQLIRGWAQRLLGDMVSAEESLRLSVQLDPNSPRSQFELGKLYQATERHEQAMRAYRTALESLFGEKTAIPARHELPPSNSHPR